MEPDTYRLVATPFPIEAQAGSEARDTLDDLATEAFGDSGSVTQLSETDTIRRERLEDTLGLEAGPQMDRALAAYAEGRLEEAWADLRDIAECFPDHSSTSNYLRLLEEDLKAKWEAEVGDLEAQLELTRPAEEWLHLNLKPEQGYVLSLIDGRHTIAEILDLSNLGRVRGLEVIVGLLRDEIARPVS